MTSADSSFRLPAVGDHLLGRIRIEQVLENFPHGAIVLADDESRFELAIVFIADSQSILEELLACRETATVLKRFVQDDWHIAQVRLDQHHLAQFGDRLFVPTQRISSSVSIEPPTSANVPRLPLGTRFADRYEIEALLGVGGMGEVYRAFDHTLHRGVALKVLRIDGLPNIRLVDARRRLFQEARLVSTLRHPNIVEVFDAGEDQGISYIVLELCTAGNLSSARRSRALTENIKLRWLSQIAYALAFAHRHGIVHRDIKPENVLLKRDDTATVADFGIAKALGGTAFGSTTTGLIGTPRYMAPEQLLGEKVDGRTDQFAWGLLAFELCAGQPIERNDLNLSLSKAADTDGHDGLFRKLLPIISRTLATRCADRFASMDEVAEALAVITLTDTPEPLCARRKKTQANWNRPPARLLVLVPSFALGLAVAGASIEKLYVQRTQQATAIAPRPAAHVDRELPSEPGAAAAFQAAVQAWRDGALSSSLRNCNNALTLAPGFGPAHLLILSTGSYWPTYEAQEHFRRAMELRATLSPRDLAILDAYAPLLDGPPNLSESTLRFNKLAQHFPEDATILVVVARAQVRVGKLHDAIATLETAERLDPELHIAKAERALALVLTGEVNAARTVFRECVAASPAAAICFANLISLESNEGNCGVVAALATRFVANIPESGTAYRTLANALAATGGTEQAVDEAIALGVAKLSMAASARVENADRFGLAVRRGNFVVAHAILERWADAVRSAPDEPEHADFLRVQAALAFEMNMPEKADNAARDYLDRRAAWRTNGYADSFIDAVAIRYRAGGISNANFEDTRDQWLTRSADVEPRLYEKATRWIHGFASAARTATDARVALDVLPDYEPLPDPLTRTADDDYAIGEVFRLTGDHKTASVYLERAAHSCRVLRYPFEIQWAVLALARLRANTGDIRAACENYGRLTSPRPDGTPGRTAELARRESTALNCKTFSPITRQ